MIRITPAIAIALALVETTSCIALSRAQLNSSIQIASYQQQSPVRGRPRRTKPAGTRSPCEQTNTDFTPLLPDTESEYSGFTLREHPTFWFYIPYKTDSVKSGSFVLKEREGNVVYPIDFKLPKTPGFISVTIPETVKPLEKNKQYIWKFVLYCASQNSDQPPSISHEGLVQRGNMDNLEIQLRTAKLPERIKLYIDNKIWYDASTDLAQIHSLPQVWRNLLTAIGLEELEQEPIVGSVVPIEN
jgi:hypothetical protein